MAEAVTADPMVEVVIFERDLWLSRAVGLLRPVLAQQGLRVPGLTVSAEPCSLDHEVPSYDAEFRFAWFNPERVDRVVVDSSVRRPTKVLTLVVHELLHASHADQSDFDDWHGTEYRTLARRVGLRGDPSSDRAGWRLRRQLRGVARELGRYPSPSDRVQVFSTGVVQA